MDAIIDTTGYAERNVDVNDIYIESINFNEKKNRYLHKDNKDKDNRNIFYERTLFPESLDFMLNVINPFKIEKQSCCVGGMGKKIYRLLNIEEK